MNPALHRLLSQPRYWFAALGAGLLLTTASSWLQGAEGLAQGTWVVEREDVSNYLRDHWDAPALVGTFLMPVQFLGQVEVTIELEGDGRHQVTARLEPIVLGHKAGPAVTVAEVGRWTLIDASMGGGTIRFTPERYDLLAPKDRTAEDIFRRAASMSPSVREFTWETVDADTLLWRPIGASSAHAPIRVRRR